MKYVAFLKGINLGGHTLKMKDLVGHLEALGFSAVETFIASGNAIFEATGKVAELEERIEAHLKKELGWGASTFLRTLPELAKVVEHQPFAGEEGTVYVGFAKKNLAADALDAMQGDLAEFAVHGREFYWLSREPMSQTKITTARLEKALASEVTMRNSTTRSIASPSKETLRRR